DRTAGRLAQDVLGTVLILPLREPRLRYGRARQGNRIGSVIRLRAILRIVGLGMQAAEREAEGFTYGIDQAEIGAGLDLVRGHVLRSRRLPEVPGLRIDVHVGLVDETRL